MDLIAAGLGLLGALLVAVLACGLLLWRLGAILARRGREVALVEALTRFAAALDAAASDPRGLLTWVPLARAARRACPELFAELDAVWGAPFPISHEQIEAAHARWSAEWLAWERRHDAEYRLKAAAVAAESEQVGGEAAAVARDRLAALEQEKLERYQQRYEEYVRVSKALAALLEADERRASSGTGSGA
jgi:hypothetical protein